MNQLARRTSEIQGFAVDSGLSLHAKPDDRWCLVRWMQQPGTQSGPKSYFCGPLSPITTWHAEHIGDLGFPRGNVGNVAVWPSQAEAELFTKSRGVSEDVPTPLHMLHFSTRVYSHWDGTEIIPYDGGDLRVARLVLGLFEVWAKDQVGSNYWKATVECRPTTALLRERPLLPAEPTGGAGT